MKKKPFGHFGCSYLRAISQAQGKKARKSFVFISFDTSCGKLCFLVRIPLDLQIPRPPRARPSPPSCQPQSPLVPAPVPLVPLRYGAAGALGDLLARQCVVSRGLSFFLGGPSWPHRFEGPFIGARKKASKVVGFCYF